MSRRLNDIFVPICALSFLSLISVSAWKEAAELSHPKAEHGMKRLEPDTAGTCITPTLCS